MARAIYAEVIVDISHYKVDQIFHYNIPPKLEKEIKVGIRVKVPFGNSHVVGYLVGISSTSPVDRTKDIIEVLDQEPIISNELIELTEWLSYYYLCNRVQALKCVLPNKIKQFKGNTQKKYRLLDSIEVEYEKIKKRAPKQAQIIELLKSKGLLSTAEMKKIIPLSQSSLKALLEKGLIEVVDTSVDCDPYKSRSFKEDRPPELTADQKNALAEVSKPIAKGEHDAFLLHGVTGSGKTEIYLNAIQKVLENEKQAIVLVPEIALTPQIVERFKARFGDKVAVMHSRLSDSEKYDQWWRINKGLASVVIGARSAVFAPFKKLGLIIIDEEHENSYKQEESPKYHVREVALKRAEMTNSVLIMGSATPAIETYWKASRGKFKILQLPNRVQQAEMPEVTIIDMRNELKKGNKSIFSSVLYHQIMDKIAKRQQVILFLNRRGYSTFVMCRQCGFVAKCDHCSISLTYHQNKDRLKCHYCNYSIGSPKLCPSCNSKYIRYFGIGTQKVEEEVKRTFPHSRILRMDVDTTTKKGSHEKIFNLFKSGRADILIGTQMIAKGLDFPNVTLVGVLAADSSLNLPDFRGCERTFQLLTQVSGRAGRSILKGEVIVQTYEPNNYAIKAASNHDYESFFNREIEERNMLKNPPFSSLIRVVITGTSQSQVELRAKQVKELFKPNSYVSILGPVVAPLGRIKDRFRWQIILKGNLSNLHKMVRDNYKSILELQNEVSINIDVEPYNMM
ncbi:primosomal protein N' (replication factor Y) [Desulfitispora alkaliphila]|uniref:primosomal protein N' n=1 Tax=Desulfitispora alkaliphila TaxID=622674 RepID=UPI003D23D59B